MNGQNVSTNSSIFSSPKKKQKLISDEDILFGGVISERRVEPKQKLNCESAPTSKHTKASNLLNLNHPPANPFAKNTKIQTSNDLKQALDVGNKQIQKTINEPSKAKVAPKPRKW